MFEYCYTLTIGVESKTVVLATFEGVEKEKYESLARQANITERKPGLKGQILQNPAFYFVRPPAK